LWFRQKCNGVGEELYLGRGWLSGHPLPLTLRWCWLGFLQFFIRSCIMSLITLIFC
jgi:hypothetical protein